MMRVHPRQRAVFVCEVGCSLGALACAFTGCWAGWAIAFNGVLSHGLVATNHPSGGLAVAFDTLSCLFLSTVGLFTTSWQPQTTCFALVMAHAFLVSNLLRNRHPYAAASVHIIVVQGGAFVTLVQWDECWSLLNPYLYSS
jgi:hypothetical protein